MHQSATTLRPPYCKIYYRGLGVIDLKVPYGRPLTDQGLGTLAATGVMSIETVEALAPSDLRGDPPPKKTKKKPKLFFLLTSPY